MRRHSGAIINKFDDSRHKFNNLLLSLIILNMYLPPRKSICFSALLNCIQNPVKHLMFDQVLDCLFLLILVKSITHGFRRHYPLNSFSTNVPLLYRLKTSENLRFSVFRGYISGSLVENRLKSMLSTKRENKKTVN